MGSSIETKTGQQIIDSHIETIPERFRGILYRALNGLSRADGVKAKCLDCVGFEDPIERIKNCESYRCPLRPYRPYKK